MPRPLKNNCLDYCDMKTLHSSSLERDPCAVLASNVYPARICCVLWTSRTFGWAGVPVSPPGTSVPLWFPNAQRVLQVKSRACAERCHRDVSPRERWRECTETHHPKMAQRDCEKCHKKFQRDSADECCRENLREECPDRFHREVSQSQRLRKEMSQRNVTRLRER